MGILFEDPQEGTCLIRRPFKFLDFKAALEDIELTEEFFVQADEQIQDKNTRLDLRFEMGTSTLIADSANAAEQSRLLRELGSYGNNLLQLTIMGAASPDGSMKRNQELAQQRANVARQMLKGGLAVTPSISVKVYTWEDVVTQLKEQARTEQADQVQAIIDGGGDDMSLTSKMKALPFYSLDIEPILNRMRAMSARYKYRQQRVLTPEECVEEFHKYKKAYWEGTKHFSAGDFYHLYEILEDSLELDTLTQIAYREISSEMDYEMDYFRQQGLTPIGYLDRLSLLSDRLLAAHCIHLTEPEMDTIAATNTMVVNNPESNMGNAVGCSPVLKMFSKGIMLGLGTDAYTHDMLESLKVALTIQRHNAGMPNVAGNEVTTMLFQNNAKIAARYFDAPLGVIREGAAADIIVMDYLPFTPLSGDNLDGHMIFGMNGRQCRTTIANGRLLYLDREFVDIDEEKLSAEIFATAEKLWGRVNG